MIKAVIAVVAVVAAFAAGMAGVYVMMPTLAPEKVEKAQAHLDSLALVDSLAWAYSQGVPPGTTARPPGTTARPPDSLAASPAPADSTARPAPTDQPAPPAAVASATDEAGEQDAAPDTPAQAPDAEEAQQTALHDSLAAVQRQFEQLMRDQQQLLEEVNALKNQVDEQEVHGDEIEALSGTLAKLEDKELAGVVERLDMGVLEALYERASARNRKRLLQAMPSEAAAGFVRRLVRPNKTAVTNTVAPPDTVAALPASGSQPGSLNE